MTCPDCGVRLEVVKTLVLADATQRLRQCQCGSRFVTVEKLLKRLPATAPQPPGNDPATASQPREKSIGSGSLPPDSNPDVADLPERARELDYPAEFETIWAETGRRGHKEPACKAWKKKGKPAAALVVPAWNAYKASLEEWRNPKDLSSWLNINGHRQEWIPRAPKPADTRCAFHKLPGTRGKLPRQGQIVGCPECKHSAAALASREAVPTPIADALSSAKWSGKYPTPEEMAEISGKRSAG